MSIGGKFSILIEHKIRIAYIGISSIYWCTITMLSDIYITWEYMIRSNMKQKGVFIWECTHVLIIS